MKVTSSSSRKAKPSRSTGTPILESIEESMDLVETEGHKILLYGPEGVGKSSLAGHAPAPFFLCDSQEHGIHKLKRTGQVPSKVSIGRDIADWHDLIASIQSFADDDHSYQTLVLDALTFAQRMCFTTCCEEMYKGEWGKEGFMAYQQGPNDSAQKYWPDLLDALDRVIQRGMNVIVIAHSAVATFKNPEGSDYDRFVPDLHDSDRKGVTTIGKSTYRWADAILFLRHNTNLEVEITGKKTRVRGTGGEERIIGTEFCATYIAKNRYNLPPIVSVEDPVPNPKDNAKVLWNTLWGHIQKSLDAGVVHPQPTAKKRKTA